MRFVVRVAERFSIPVTEKAVAGALPVIGAVTSAGINTIFIDHFQEMAHGHFIYRRLERIYGPDLVRAAFGKLDA